MADSLNDRFKAFLSQLPFAEVIDDLKLPPEFDESKRADILIENRKAIIEIKSLESDPEHKIHTELKNHQGFLLVFIGDTSHLFSLLRPSS